LKEEEIQECAINGKNGGCGWGGKGVILMTFLLRQTRMKSGHFIEILRTRNALPFSSCITSRMLRNTALS